jgi:succinate dehydrogenase/fumarate reductase-like Fe-S protein
MCTVTCPKGLNPQSAIQELLKMVKDLEEDKADE